MSDRLSDYWDVEERAYVVPMSELLDFRLGDVPPHSQIYVTGLPAAREVDSFLIHITNGGDLDNYEYLTVYGFFGFANIAEYDRIMPRFRRAWAPLLESGLLPDPLVIGRDQGFTGGGAGFSINCAKHPELVIKEAIEPLLSLIDRLAAPEGQLFICHASEDKPIAKQLALFMQNRGIQVWLDKWEIKVGDSIVEKINEGLASASYLAVLLSHTSVTKPWVMKEFSAALMRQLSDRSIRVLPVRLDNCRVPPILADLRHADCRSCKDTGFQEVLDAISNLEKNVSKTPGKKIQLQELYNELNGMAEHKWPGYNYATIRPAINQLREWKDKAKRLIFDLSGQAELDIFLEKNKYVEQMDEYHNRNVGGIQAFYNEAGIYLQYLKDLLTSL